VGRLHHVPDLAGLVQHYSANRLAVL